MDFAVWNFLQVADLAAESCDQFEAQLAFAAGSRETVGMAVWNLTETFSTHILIASGTVVAFLACTFEAAWPFDSETTISIEDQPRGALLAGAIGPENGAAVVFIFFEIAAFSINPLIP